MSETARWKDRANKSKSSDDGERVAARHPSMRKATKGCERAESRMKPMMLRRVIQSKATRLMERVDGHE